MMTNKGIYQSHNPVGMVTWLLLQLKLLHYLFESQTLYRQDLKAQSLDDVNILESIFICFQYVISLFVLRLPYRNWN